MSNWTLETIDWDRFDASKVDPEILRNIKAAAMVERNGGDYGIYLGRVFADDRAFVADLTGWVAEEVQHGMALGRWAQIADPAWDFDAAFERFREGYKLPLDAEASIRGSQAGEMMARCIVETGTSSYYSALKDASTEPVLKQMAIAQSLDEVATGSHGHDDFYWGGAASTIFWVDPVEDLVVIFMTQLIPSSTFDFRGQLKSIIYSSIVE